MRTWGGVALTALIGAAAAFGSIFISGACYLLVERWKVRQIQRQIEGRAVPGRPVLVDPEAEEVDDVRPLRRSL